VVDRVVANLQYQQTSEGDQVIDPASLPQARILVNFIETLSRRCRFRGNWSDCERLCYTAINVSRAIDNASGIASSCLDLSLISYYRDDMNTAQRWALEAQKAGPLGHKERIVCLAKLQLGLITLRRGDIEQATVLMTTAMENYKQLSGDGGDLPHFMNNLGELAEQQGDLATARSWYQQALDIRRRQNHLPYIAADLLSLGKVVFATGDYAGAQAYYTESLGLAQECGRVDVIARVCYGIASLESIQNQRDSAESHARQALDLFRRLGMKREQAEAEALLARLGT
jgi:tetratricopeptide (TPR) repeat protein